MTKLIEVDALKESIIAPRSNGKALIEEWIDAQPTVDAEPIRHGKWIKIHPQGIYECSACHQIVMTSDIECYSFCHQCGARMDEDTAEPEVKNDKND